MKSYLSGRSPNSEDFVSTDSDSSFSSYLDSSSVASSESTDNLDHDVENLHTEQIHQDETGIKVEVVSEGDQPRKILIHIPDGRIIELGCEY
jgi:hypothetical protein